MGSPVTPRELASSSPTLERVISRDVGGPREKPETETMVGTAYTVSLSYQPNRETTLDPGIIFRRYGQLQSLTYAAVAPECCGADGAEQTSPRPYTKTADIWSLGCLFSNMLVRSSLGQEGVDRYREARVAENQNTFLRTYAPQCFHDGIKRLSSVDRFHREALERHPDDDVLRAVSDIILDCMLKRKNEREDDALTVRSYWENHILAMNNAGNGLAAAGTTSTPASSAAPRRPLQTAPIASWHSRGSAASSFYRRDTLPQAPVSSPPMAPSIISARTRRPDITVTSIANFLRQSQKSRLLFRPGEKLETAFPGLLPALIVVGSRDHVGLLSARNDGKQYKS
jgi:serine/threonine protein kinase